MRSRLLSNDATLNKRLVQKAQMYRKDAQALYQSGDYFDSLSSLAKAVKIFKIDRLTTEFRDENEDAFRVVKDCYLFSASCYIKINQYDSAMNLMDELLEIENTNMRAYYLRGRAFYHRKEIVSAYRDFTKALDLNPIYMENDKAIISKYIAEIKKMYPE